MFQQDDAPAHFHHDVRTFLDEQYPNRWIDRGGLVVASKITRFKSVGFYLLGLFEKYCL